MAWDGTAATVGAVRDAPTSARVGGLPKCPCGTVSGGWDAAVDRYGRVVLLFGDAYEPHARGHDGDLRHLDHAQRLLLRGHQEPHWRSAPSGAALHPTSRRGALPTAPSGVGRGP